MKNGKWRSKHASNRNMQDMILMAEYTHRGTKQCKLWDKRTLSTTCSDINDHKSNSTPEGRVTVLITHVDTLQTEFFM